MTGSCYARVAAPAVLVTAEIEDRLAATSRRIRMTARPRPSAGVGRCRGGKAVAAHEFGMMLRDTEGDVVNPLRPHNFCWWDRHTRRVVPDDAEGADPALFGRCTLSDGRRAAPAFQLLEDRVRDCAPEWAESITGIKVTTKCTLWVDRIGERALPVAERKPACAMACPTNARLFGDVHAARRGPGGRRTRAARAGEPCFCCSGSACSPNAGRSSSRLVTRRTSTRRRPAENLRTSGHPGPLHQPAHQPRHHGDRRHARGPQQQQPADAPQPRAAVSPLRRRHAGRALLMHRPSHQW